MPSTLGSSLENAAFFDARFLWIARGFKLAVIGTRAELSTGKDVI